MKLTKFKKQKLSKKYYLVILKTGSVKFLTYVNGIWFDNNRKELKNQDSVDFICETYISKNDESL